MFIDVLRRRYTGESQTRGSELYLELGAAIEAIDLATQSDVAVVGVEAFHLESEKTMPLMDHIASMSPRGTLNWKEYVRAANSFVRSVLSDWIQESQAEPLWVALAIEEQAANDPSG